LLIVFGCGSAALCSKGSRSPHVLIAVPFRRPGQPDIAIGFVVDTGFTGELCLPPDAVTALGLPFRYDLPVRMADDRSVTLSVHDAAILWNGAQRIVRVLASGRRPLLGTALLAGCELLVQFRESGLVRIDPL
jgi:clan AA aspartic protease